MDDLSQRRGSFRPSARFWVAAAAIAIALTSCLDSNPKSDAAPQQWWQDRGPVVPHDKFPADCSLCHNSSDWRQVRDDFSFDHEAETGVALKGAHAKAECLRCHNDRGPVAMFAERGCSGCHDDQHSGQLGPDCTSCHGQDDWLPIGQVAAHNRTRFPLVGAHVATACSECHEGADVGNFSRTEITCESCHQADLKQATDPDHIAMGFSDRCERCHVPTTWKDAGFTHSFFPLTGAHSVPACAACHANNSFKGTPTNCASCHLDEYDTTSNPSHSALGFSKQCQECHNAGSWQGAIFDHSGFPLIGAHAATACAQCHLNGSYEGTPKNCFACHQADYQATADPPHAAAGFSQQCEQCHDPGGWEGATFAHSGFPLSGGHAAASCMQCHGNGVYAGTPVNCVACHLADYNATTEPDHEAIGFPQDCQQCHNAATWDGATFGHSSFPLTGAHGAASCSQCHANGTYIGTPSDCAACHLADYNATIEPDHEAIGFPQDCQQCHNTASWQGALFNHDTFPLTGAHTAASCSDCHINGVYAGTPESCSACHLPDYNGTRTPDHAAAGFPTTCELCHSTSTWVGASFNHSSFPLTGAHTAASCSQCHVNGVYKGTPSTCVACHLTDYNGTNDPDHASVGFPTSCETCHGTNTWQGAVFNHSFPITSGKHKNLSCTSCHVVPGNTSVFSCIDCHEHGKPETDGHHHGVNGYVYASPACLSCHPNGKAD